jgi:hypothetical protein
MPVIPYRRDSHPRDLIGAAQLPRVSSPALMRSSPVPPPLWMLIFAAAMWALNRYWPVASVNGWWLRAAGAGRQCAPATLDGRF